MTILTITGNGPLGMAIAGALEGLGQEAREAAADDDDLFMKALGCGAVIHAPAHEILDGTLDPAPDPARMRNVLRACNAPGVKLLVLVVPAGDRFAAELDLVRQHGVPFVIVETPPLEDELAARIAAQEGSLWLPREAHAKLAKRAAVHAAVTEALTNDDLQGRTIAAEADAIVLAIAVRSAADSAGRTLAVHAVPGVVDRAARTVRGWLGWKAPPLRALCDSLAGS